jgi:hypothetical protein
MNAYKSYATKLKLMYIDIRCDGNIRTVSGCNNTILLSTNNKLSIAMERN